VFVGFLRRVKAGSKNGNRQSQAEYRNFILFLLVGTTSYVIIIYFIRICLTNIYRGQLLIYVVIAEHLRTHIQQVNCEHNQYLQFMEMEPNTGLEVKSFANSGCRNPIIFKLHLQLLKLRLQLLMLSSLPCSVFAFEVLSHLSFKEAYSASRRDPVLYSCFNQTHMHDPTRDNYYAIGKASEVGNARIMKHLLKLKNPPEVIQNSICTAAVHGRVDVLQLLLAHHGTDSVDPALDNAVNNNRTEVVKILLKANSSVTTRSLRLAASSGNLGMVQMLSNHTQRKGFIDYSSAAELSAELGHTEILQFLLTPPRSAETSWLLQLAASKGRLDTVKYLLTTAASSASNKAVARAAEYGELEVVQLLLTDPHTTASTDLKIAVISAALRNYTDILKVLLDDGRADPRWADPRYGLRVAFELAVFKKLGKVLRLLIADGRADPASHENEPIRYAARFGHTEIVRLLLADPRVNAGDWNNEPICTAAVNGYVDVVRLLLDNKRVDPTARNNYAVRNSKGDVRRMLLGDARVKETCLGLVCSFVSMIYD
jgi:ankyrin repeat protein